MLLVASTTITELFKTGQQVTVQRFLILLYVSAVIVVDFIETLLLLINLRPLFLEVLGLDMLLFSFYPLLHSPNLQ